LDGGLIYESELLTCMACRHDHQTGYEEVTGQTLDISKWTDFEFYDLVCWWHTPSKPTMTDNPQCLACWLGDLNHVGSDLCYWLVTKYGKIVSKSSSIQHVTHDDYLQKDKHKEIKVFDQKLKDWLDDKNIVVPSDCLAGMFLKDIDDLVNDSGGIIHKEDHTPIDNDYGENFPPELPEANEEDVIDKYLNAELISNLRMHNGECS
jgi:hypothetical protein